MVEILLNYWWVLIIILAILGIALSIFNKFLKMPTIEQINAIKEWLLFAVAQAEKELGNGTGALKLRYVYDMFVSKFPTLAPLITFHSFSFLVDEALKQFKDMLATNVSVQNYIGEDVDKNEKH